MLDLGECRDSTVVSKNMVAVHRVQHVLGSLFGSLARWFLENEPQVLKRARQGAFENYKEAV